MSQNGFDQQQPSHDLSFDERLNLLIQQGQQMQREAIQAHLRVPPLPLVDVVVHQGDQMPRETVGEWNSISSLAQGIVSSSGEGPPSVGHGGPLANGNPIASLAQGIVSSSGEGAPVRRPPATVGEYEDRRSNSTNRPSALILSFIFITLTHGCRTGLSRIWKSTYPKFRFGSAELCSISCSSRFCPAESYGG